VNLKSQDLKAGYTASIIADGLNPVSITTDHHGRIWLAEKDGRVLIIDEEEQLQVEPFVNIEVDEFNERGLLGIVLHPDIDNEPYLYVYYTVPGLNRNRVSRFGISGNFALPGSEEVILELDELSGSIHNGGAMVFDRNNYLFIATGDSGLPSNSQNKDNLLGKILRITENGEIPATNPFFNELEGLSKAIWSFGHRNPFNLSYDPISDLLYATDVGAGDFEEINHIQEGLNYGWPNVEGPLKDVISLDNYQDPYYYYDHTEGCAIVGLALIPKVTSFLDMEISNAIVYADYCKGYINYIENSDTSYVKALAHEIERPLNIIYNEHNKAIYVQTRSGLGGGSQQDNTSTRQGKLWKLRFSGNGQPNIVLSPEDKVIAKSESTYFEIKAVGSKPLTYDWYIEDTLYRTTTSDTLYFTSTSQFADSTAFWCVVSNDEGSDTSSIFSLIVLDNQRPEVVISKPSVNATYKAGDTIWYSGYVIDEEDGVMSPETYNWSVNFHHDLHSHPFIESVPGIDEGFFVLPTVGEPDTNVWVRISLSGKDQTGLLATQHTDVYPEFNQIHIRSNVKGKINMDGVVLSLPFDLKSTINLERTIEVPSQQEEDGFLLLFSHWEDGSTNRIRTFSVMEQVMDTLVVYFDTLRIGNGSGLYGQYYNNKNLEGNPVISQIDSMINFRWGPNSPQDGVVNEDNFSVSWRGYLEPLFSEKYQLHLTTDDGTRMWFNDELVIDDWMNHPPKEHDIEVDLEAETKYKIEIEYFESEGGAQAELEWSSPNSRKAHIPASQLFPIELGSFHGRLWHDVNQDNEIQESEPYISKASVILLNDQNDIIHITLANEDGFFAFREFEIGSYRILIIPASEHMEKDFGYGLNAEGYSALFTLTANGLIEDKFALIDPFSSNIHEISSKNLKIYPNPVANELYLDQLNFDYDEVTIFAQNGSQIRFYDKIEKIDFSDFLPGSYFIHFKSEKSSVIGKVVKI
jgi:hypothetical protein